MPPPPKAPLVLHPSYGRSRLPRDRGGIHPAASGPTRRHAAALKQDFQELARLAHWLKGAGGTAGFPTFTQPAKHLESLVQTGSATRSRPPLRNSCNCRSGLLFPRQNLLSLLTQYSTRPGRSRPTDSPRPRSRRCRMWPQRTRSRPWCPASCFGRQPPEILWQTGLLGAKLVKDQGV